VTIRAKLYIAIALTVLGPLATIAVVTKRILLGPEIDNFEDIAGTAGRLAAYETRAAGATEVVFDDARDDVRRRLIAVALGAAGVIVLLLLTATDIAHLAIEGDRRRRRAGA
jgi:hypothetical protein